MGVARGITLAAALVAVAMLAVSGPGTRLDWWAWPVGFVWMRWALYVGFGAALVALLLLLVPRARGPRPARLVAALFIGLMAGAPLLALMTIAKRLPYIHDITTDTVDPPAFVTLVAERRAAPNGVAYGGAEVAAAQQKAYPGVRPLTLAAPPAAAYPRALEAARAMGWHVAAADPAAGRIEATATTLWFGFKDDVVIRIRAGGAGSRIDVRSVSRVGQSDLGANARRIEEFLARLTFPKD